MGRYWQTRLLMKVSPIFEFVPIEKGIKDNQEKYYKVLELSDKAGNSTSFIEFMLAVINESLREMIDDTRAPNPDYTSRSEYALSVLTDWFDRKEYMKTCKGISTATASRDIRQLLDEGKIESAGSGRMTKYKKKLRP